MIQHIKNKRKSKRIPTHFGFFDYYNFYKKIDIESKTEKVSKKMYNKVISEVNELLTDAIIYENYSFIIPYIGFELILVKFKTESYLDEKGKLIQTAPIDWRTTLSLWEKDVDAKEKKIKVRYLNRHTNGYVFKILMIRTSGRSTHLKSRMMYVFHPMRYFQRKLANSLKGDSIEQVDALIIKKKRWQEMAK